MSELTERIERHCDWLLASGCSKATIRDRRRLVEYADRHLPRGVERAHTDEIARFLANQRWKPWTRNGYFRHLNRFYEWAVSAQELTINPMVALRCPPEGDRLPNPIQTETLAYLLAVTEGPRWRDPWRLAILLAAYGGCRVGDIATLKRQDITAERMRLRNGKGGRDAYLITHPIIWDAVRDLPPGPVVRDRDGRPVTAYQLTNRGWYFFRRHGLAGVHLHQLRHWHATALLEGGADLETVRQCMRHKSITSTVNYTRITSARRRDAVHALPVIMGTGPARV